MCVYVYVRVCMCMYVYVCVCVCMCMYVRTYVCVYMCIYIYIYIHSIIYDRLVYTLSVCSMECLPRYGVHLDHPRINSDRDNYRSMYSLHILRLLRLHVYSNVILGLFMCTHVCHASVTYT